MEEFVYNMCIHMKRCHGHLSSITRETGGWVGGQTETERESRSRSRSETETERHRESGNETERDI